MYTGIETQLQSDDQVPTTARLGFGTATLLRSVWPADGRAGAPRRLAGAVPRHGEVDSKELEQR